mmetsp:Transcript_33048/g.98316  ORF Transcript_33048/g.98316 Transcript_33048/m.98316 type:complete len:261 (-) Transcript_33048:187-969(-)|eukprot:CAMPEP_0113559936 /NCGR_PEP_ID=MMETSP0015_2-20120614/19163_1 /TAXON_ID=2838 /ORGANISM="Odontella" /LENGTH=260 /DNA_ID=CAMNT_0000461607 /DNA_START=163 /DNA_END=948 /DNA_ORIENTATION=+ /assembly_acc=CAM_ASM_000160
MMMNFVFTILALPFAASFAPPPAFGSASVRTTTSLSVEAVDITKFPEAVSYTITAEPPLGIILTEFQSESVPELTPVVVSDVTEGQFAARLGVREGDVLIGINGISLLEEGIGFDSVINTIQTEFGGPAGRISAKFFRGSSFGKIDGFDGLVGTIVNGGDAEEVVDEVEDVTGEGETLNLSDIFGEEEEKEEVGVGELFSSLIKETAGAVQKGLSAEEEKKEEKKSGGGFFGMFSQETIQVDDDPNQFANSANDPARKKR